MTQSGAINSGHSEPESNINEGVLHIPPKLQDYSLTIISKTLMGENRTNLKLVHSTTPANMAV